MHGIELVIHKSDIDWFNWFMFILFVCFRFGCIEDSFLINDAHALISTESFSFEMLALRWGSLSFDSHQCGEPRIDRCLIE